MKQENLTPGKKAQDTAKRARTMTKWLITYNHRTGARWNLVELGGKAGAEARGIIDLIAIRKDHRKPNSRLKRGDLLDIVLIQTKGGSAPRPTEEDRARLSMVAKYHRARAVVLAVSRRGREPALFKLKGTEWSSAPMKPARIFG